MAVDFSAGGYRFIPGVFQYSGGAAALPGHAIERVRFRAPVPLKQGFELIERYIAKASAIRRHRTTSAGGSPWRCSVRSARSLA